METPPDPLIAAIMLGWTLWCPTKEKPVEERSRALVERKKRRAA